MSQDWEKSKSDFNDLVSLWDKALKDGIFEDKKVSSNDSQNFFGDASFANKEIEDGDADYWNDVVSRSGTLFPDENMMLMEAAKKKEKEKKAKPFGDMSGDKPFDLEKSRVKTSLEKLTKTPDPATKAKGLANLPNYVMPDTVGPDGLGPNNEPKITDGLAASKDLLKLEKLKLALYNLEVQMNSKYGLDEAKAKSLNKKFSKLIDEINSISNSFCGNYSDREYKS